MKSKLYLTFNDAKFLKDIETYRESDGKRKITWVELADLVGTSLGNIYEVKKGRMPKLILYSNLCNLLGKDMKHYLKP